MKKIMVVTHERSGTHFMINSIAQNFHNYYHVENSILGKEQELYDSIMSGSEKIILKSHHHPKKFYLDDLKDIIDKVYVIYVIRNPLDVMTSCFYYFNKVNNQFPKISSVNELCYLNPNDYKFHSVYGLDSSKTMLERWLDHVNAWQEFNVHTIRYEDLKYNFFEVMDELAEGLDLPQRSRYVSPKITDPGVCNRKGISGDYLNHMSEKEIKKAEKYLEDRGYKYETRNS